MGVVDQGLAVALKAEQTTITVSTPAAAWGERGRRLRVETPFVGAAGAAAEGARQAALFGGPLVRDRAIVAGERRDLARRCIRLRGDLDYPPEGALVFVIGVQEQDNGTTVLTVLRRLA